MIVAILCLATWRLSTMLVIDTGPLGLFDWIREKIGVVHELEKDGSIRIEVYKENLPSRLFGDLFACVRCISVWIGLVFVLIAVIDSQVAFWIGLPFALSAAAILIDNYLTRG